MTNRGAPSRRAVLTGGLAAAGAAAAGGYLGRATAGPGDGTGTPASAPGNLVHPFRGEHQQGVTTPAQQQMHMVAFDVTTERRDELVGLLTDWTRAAENLTAGRPVADPRVSRNAPPEDTGEALDLGAAALTVTFGFGRTVFVGESGRDRFGLARRLPAALADPIPPMAAEKLDPSRGGGDLVVQVCAEDPLVALHAVHNLTRIAFGRASVRWTQLGYGRTSSTGGDQKTPRNLFGFKDGTASLRDVDQEALRDMVWVAGGDDPATWMEGGTYLCARKIRMHMEVWDELSLRVQEDTIGRDKLHGAPLSGGDESTPPDLAARTSSGRPTIPEDSHVARMHPSRNGGVRMLRRGYNYTDGSDRLGRLDAGLFFIAFVRDPRRHFTPLLRRMSTDRLTEYLTHLSSSVFAVPPGVREGDTHVGQRLFAP